MNLKNGRAVMWPAVLKEGLFFRRFPSLGPQGGGKGGEKESRDLYLCGLWTITLQV